jgi:hypothetical protein
MNTDKLWTAISGIERQFNNLKGELIDIDEEITQSDDAYQRGLNDAWEAAKKILQLYDFTVFGLEHDGVFESPLNKGQQMTPQEAIEKLKVYEEKQKADDEIKVGDEVVWVDEKCVVTFINRDIETSKIKDYDLLTNDGSVAENVSPDRFRKTGKHYNIDKILEALKE